MNIKKLALIAVIVASIAVITTTGAFIIQHEYEKTVSINAEPITWEDCINHPESRTTLSNPGKCYAPGYEPVVSPDIWVMPPPE